MTADTNVLLRAFVKDDPDQARVAAAVLLEADLVLIPVTVFCEYAWVLTSRYGFSPASLSSALKDLTRTAKVRFYREAVEAGLAHLDAGGDFSDGVIAFEGRRLGATVFVSFDRKAARLVAASGHPIRLLR